MLRMKSFFNRGVPGVWAGEYQKARIAGLAPDDLHEIFYNAFHYYQQVSQMHKLYFICKTIIEIFFGSILNTSLLIIFIGSCKIKQKKIYRWLILVPYDISIKEKNKTCI